MRGAHNRVGFAAQLGTARYLGTFLDDPTEIPGTVIKVVAHQLRETDVPSLATYRDGRQRWRHVAIIRKRYGFRDFKDDATAGCQLTRWLYLLCWTGGDPSRLSSFSDHTEHLGEQWLSFEESGEAFGQQLNPEVGHVGDEIGEHASLAEERMSAALGCVGLAMAIVSDRFSGGASYPAASEEAEKFGAARDFAPVAGLWRKEVDENCKSYKCNCVQNYISTKIFMYKLTE